VDGRLEVRPVLALSFAADHRLIDGDVSTAFMRTLAGYLVEPLTLFAELI
jgi:pyruvate/2-oxoglutarate dehydrogenase complex dihydrolipoamide acyltransferase (E2) component